MIASARVRLILAATLCLSLPWSAAQAAWPHDPNNGNVALCTAANDQSSPTIVSDGAGGAIVTWQDPRGGNLDIYAQRVNAAGAPQWTANGVALCTADGDQPSPKILSDGAGGAFVTWHDYRSGTVYGDIYVQRVNAAGAPQWTANGVALCTAAIDQISPTIASDGAGGALVTWQDARNGLDYDIYAQRVNGAGVPQWTADGVALCTAANHQFVPTIASDGAGGAIVTWYEDRGFTLSTDLYVQRVNAAGVPQWTANGVALCTAAYSQYNPAIITDGSGGAIVTWNDYRGGTGYADIYVQRVNATGVPQWTYNGVELCGASFDQLFPTIASDGVGGAFVTWKDDRVGYAHIYAQRVSAAGVPQWTSDGVVVSAPAGIGSQALPTIVSDGAGGAVVTWTDSRSLTNYDIYTQRVNAAGTPQWTADGVALCTAVNAQQSPTIASDGSGGAIITWQDFRSGNSNIYAQRIERFGSLGNPEPVSSSVRDIPNDQGGKVKVSWSASYLDADPAYAIGTYWIWRSVPPNVAAEALAHGANLVGEDSAQPRPGVRNFRLQPLGNQSFSWEYVGSQPARGFPSYSFVVSTVDDSVAASNPYTGILIEANSATSGAFWNSAPDSGYSVDNLGPATPAPFTGAYLAGATHLHWGKNGEADLAGYRLYRGSSAGFVPGSGNLVMAQPDTGFSDVGPAGSWYKLSAVDIHGNESVYAILGPNGTLAVEGGTLPRAVALSRPEPNPALDRTVVGVALPEAGRVDLVVYDMAGRRVRMLHSGEMGAGDHSVTFDLRDDGGRPLGSGLYFVRLQTAGRMFTRRLTLVR